MRGARRAPRRAAATARTRASSTASGTPSAELVRLTVRTRADDAPAALAEACAALGAGCRERPPGGRRGGARLLGPRLPGRRPGGPAGPARTGRRAAGRGVCAEDEDWRAGLRAFHRPVEIAGRLLRAPALDSAAPAAWPTSSIDPGMAFGTGQHPTTRACLELLARPAARRSLLDIGCGSGVLAIAARRLGFDPVWALDADPLAVEATLANARATAWACAWPAARSARDALPAARRSLANLTATLLRRARRAPSRDRRPEHARGLRAAPGGGPRRARRLRAARARRGRAATRTTAGRPCCWRAREAHLPLPGGRRPRRRARSCALSAGRLPPPGARGAPPRRATSVELIDGDGRACGPPWWWRPGTARGVRVAPATRRAAAGRARDPLPGARRLGPAGPAGREGRGARGASEVVLFTSSRVAADSRRRRLAPPPGAAAARGRRPRRASPAAARLPRLDGLRTVRGGARRASPAGRRLPDRPARRDAARRGPGRRPRRHRAATSWSAPRPASRRGEVAAARAAGSRPARPGRPPCCAPRRPRSWP